MSLLLPSVQYLLDRLIHVVCFAERRRESNRRALSEVEVLLCVVRFADVLLLVVPLARILRPAPFLRALSQLAGKEVLLLLLQEGDAAVDEEVVAVYVEGVRRA